MGFDPWAGKVSRRGNGTPLLSFLPSSFHALLTSHILSHLFLST